VREACGRFDREAKCDHLLDFLKVKTPRRLRGLGGLGGRVARTSRMVPAAAVGPALQTHASRHIADIVVVGL
jgi:hypothetical protein